MKRVVLTAFYLNLKYHKVIYDIPEIHYAIPKSNNLFCIKIQSYSKKWKRDNFFRRYMNMQICNFSFNILVRIAANM